MKIDYTPLEGGLDLDSSAMSVKAGRMLICQNFEQVFGKQGYRKIDGYERMDGRPEPHKATYYVQRFDQGSAIINVGDTVTGASASGKVLFVELESGTWSGTAAGRLILGSMSGLFVDNENILVGSLKAKADGVSVLGSIAEDLHNTYRAAAIADKRAAIQKPAGEGAILGVAVYNGNVFCVRNNVGGASAQMWRSTASGWVSVRDGLYPGGRYEFDVANFTGTSKTLTLFGCNGRGRPFKVEGTTFTYLPPIFGSQATSATSNSVGTGSKTFSIVESSRSWTVGDSVIIYSAANAANRMVGTISAYTHPSVTVNVTSSNGSGTLTDWEIGLSSFADKPYLIRSHKNHLFLGFPSGQLQHSNLGDPMTFTTTSGLFGLGDELTGLTSLKGDLLGVMCKSKIQLLAGSSTSDWELTLHSDSAGARSWTTQGNVGNAIFVDDRGITTLQSTLNFGSFEPSIVSREVAKWLSQYIGNIQASALVKNKYQYRLYFVDGSVLTGTIKSAEPQIKPSDVSFSTQKYLHSVTCTTQGDVGDYYDAIFFGTSDGWVMREDAGTSFDGEEIDSVMRLQFNHFKSPSVRKRFRRLVIELESPGEVDIKFRQQFDYADGFYPTSATQTATATGNGGVYDLSQWDTFYWSKPINSEAVAHIDGAGRNMGLLIWHTSAIDEPFFLQGLLIHYSEMGLQR